MIKHLEVRRLKNLRIVVVARHFPLSREQVLYSFVFDEASRLTKECEEVHVVRGEYGDDSNVDGMHVHSLKKLNSSLISFLCRTASDFPLSSFLNPFKSYYYCGNYAQTVAGVAIKQKIDLLHAHFAFPEGFVAKLAKKSVRKPLVVTLHGSDILTEPSIDYGDRLRKDCDDKVRRVLESADKVLVASKAVFDEASKAGCSRDRLEYLPNGVDLNRLNLELDGGWVRSKLGIRKRPIVLTVRALVPKNGVEYLIMSALEVWKRHPEVVFIIVGEGPLRLALEKLVDDMGLSQNVIFIRKASYDDLPYYYSACDVFVIPSIIEAFGLVTVEAMACGKPVVGTSVGGIPDTIEDGKNGFLVPPRDPQSLAEKILLLLENSTLGKEMGLKGRKMAEGRFSIRKRIDAIKRIYSEVV